MYHIPENFTRAMREVYGDEGEAWLKRLPMLLDECARRWSMTIGSPYALSYNYVAPASRADGTLVVLKIGVPSLEVNTQIPALQHYSGNGMIELLDYDRELGAMLLEHLAPGQPLASIVEEDDVHATSIAAQIMRQLWRPAPDDAPFPSISDWIGGMQTMRVHFDGGTGPFPARIVEEAESLFAELLASQAAPVLLHGDLHHENILSAQRQPWLALDPKGVLGEPAYEVGALLRNQLWHLPQPTRVMARRVAQLADELEIDIARVRGWALAQAVLSAWWSVEDHGHGWEEAIACAELLAAIRV